MNIINEGIVNRRVHTHMENTLKDIKCILEKRSMSDAQKLNAIKFSIRLLESVKCEKQEEK